VVDIDASAASATTVTLTVVLAAGAIVGSAQKLLVSARSCAGLDVCSCARAEHRNMRLPHMVCPCSHARGRPNCGACRCM